MRDGLTVFDADAHTIDAVDLYDRYLDPAFRSRVRRVENPLSPMPIYEVDGVRTLQLAEGRSDLGNKESYARWTPQTMEEVFGEPARNGWDARSVAAAIASQGVDVAMIYGPGYDIWIRDIDPALAAEMAKAYCRWLVDYREASGGRVIGAAPLPVQDVDRAVDVLRYAHDELGMRAFWCRPNAVPGRTLGDRAFDRLYAELAEREVPLGVHDFMGGVGLPAAGSDRFSGLVDQHCCEHPMEQQMAMLAMISQGVFDRFPSLQVGFLEAGSAWAPWWLDRMDEHMETVRWWSTTGLQLRPREYFARNCWITTECEEHLLYQVIAELGDDRLLFATDFPHPDAKFPGAVDAFLALKHVSEESKRKILWDNALGFYRLTEAELPPPSSSG
jgi:predicted TIM-barrel fold metal-dependent hydrolase